MPCSLLRITTAKDAEPLLQRLARRGDGGAAVVEAETKVRAVLAEVKAGGLKAVAAYTRAFDAPAFTSKQFALSRKALEAAASALPRDDRRAIEAAAANIRTFHEAQTERSWFITRPDGTILGRRVTPVDRAGLYVPGGKGGSTPLISSLLMNAIPAQVAGVSEIAVISPPRADGSPAPAILAAAHILGLEEVYAVGGPWGIAALAYGVGPLKPVDVIAGPGNIYVATAKRLLIGSVGIDMIAGPSEICIIADESADPEWIAADMLSQAEHDELASSVCLCTVEGLAEKVRAALSAQLRDLPRRDIAKAALKEYGAVVETNLDTALDLSNTLAPEHLELLVETPWEVLPRVRHAGAVFLGRWSPEPMGDYFAGPNHVLPTMGTARFSSALGVEVFCKKISVLAASREFTRTSAEAVARLARMEGLEAHARSALVRTRAAGRR